MTAPMTAVTRPLCHWRLEPWGPENPDYYGNLLRRRSHRLRVLVPTAGPGALFHANGNVKRKLEEEAIIGVCFDPLDGIAFDTLNRYLRERLLRGGI